MRRASRSSTQELLADPFGEWQVPAQVVRARLLGADFEFRSDRAELLTLARWAYEHLPPHRLRPPVPQVQVRLALAPRSRPGRVAVPAIGMLASDALLCGSTDAASFVAMSPAERSALLVVARDLLPHPYHVRYELLEFCVFTLAARVQRLVPLHAACIARRGQAVLLLGDSGAGKSTTTVQALLEGWELIAEDSAFIEPRTLRATGIANFLHLQRQSLRFLPRSAAQHLRRSPTIRRRSGVLKLEIDARRSGWRLAQAPAALAAVVFLSATPAGPAPLLRELTRRELARRLERSQPYAAQQPHWSFLLQQLRHVAALELRRPPHPAQAVQALSALTGPAERSRP